ncbi:MAG: chromate transporter [Firmicutes bacterium]|nr:chromate transporter [Bacillota bacterium]
MKLAQLFWAFSKVSILGYGGGPSLIPLVETEVVDVYKWLTAQEFTDALATGYALPGPIATKTAAVVGYKVAGFWGSLVATLGMVLPTAFLILVLYQTLVSLNGNPKVEGVLKGIRAVVIALLIMVVFDLWPSSISGLPTLALAALTLVALVVTHIHPAIAIVAGAVIGYMFL